jgi:arylsulfatase A-like enzyme
LDTIGQTHDIGTTILERAQIETAWGMQGGDLCAGATRDAAFIQYAHQKEMDEIGVPPNIHTIRDGRFRLSVLQDMDWGELYDLDADPGEFRNLWNDPAHAGDKARLMECLIRAELAHVDRSPMPTGRA